MINGERSWGATRAERRSLRGMCRSIRTLRPPYVDAVEEEDMRAAALQYVRKVSGFRTPSPANAEAFDRAVSDIAAATAELLADLKVGARVPGRAAG